MHVDYTKLQALCATFRRDIIDILYAVQTGHPGGSLSAVEILTAIFFVHARVNAANPSWEDRDRVVLCKGHAAPILYRILAEKGFFSVEEMKTLRQCGSMLPGHPSAKVTPGVDLASGPLGIGLSAAVGMALASRLDDRQNHIYAVLGDGELNEGTVWEALMSAVKFKTGNLIVIVDNNHVQLDGTCEEIMPSGDLLAKFRAFGANALCVDGHDLQELCCAIDTAKADPQTPTVILAQTVKGKGVSFMEGKSSWHGSPIGEKEYQQAILELGGATYGSHN